MTAKMVSSSNWRAIKSDDGNVTGHAIVSQIVPQLFLPHLPVVPVDGHQLELTSRHPNQIEGVCFQLDIGIDQERKGKIIPCIAKFLNRTTVVSESVERSF